MLVIDRKDGSVSGQLGPEEQDALWRAIVQALGPKFLAENLEKANG